MPDQTSAHTGTGQQSNQLFRCMRRWPLLVGGILLLFQGCATNPSPPVSPSDEARTQAKIAYLLSDYQRTLAIVLPRAEAGDPWAQYTLGYMFYYGRGIAQDRQKARSWIESAAANGYAPAQQALQRLSAPPPMPAAGDNGTLEPAPAATEETTSSPAEQSEPVNAQTSEPAPAQESTPSQPSNPSVAAPIPAMTPDQTPATVPGDQPEQKPQSPQPPPDPLPPQTSLPTSNAEAILQPPPDEPPDKGIKGRAWITRQDPHHFTLQLASSLDEAALIRLIQKHGIGEQAAYYKTMQRGKTWYSLLYGSYSKRSDAHQAMRKLPRALRRDSPRIRSFREIQDQLGPTS